MKLKDYREKYEKKIKKMDKKPKQFIDVKWVLFITIMAYIISIVFSGITEAIVPYLSTFIGIIIILLIIVLGVISDMIGVAVTAASLKPFNSMAAKKIKGSKTAIMLIQNAEKVSAFCNDVIGDVCSIISGSVGILISQIIASELKLNNSFVTLLLTAFIAALTIGGKAMGKSLAINKSDVIIFRVSKIITIFKKEKESRI